MDTPNTRPKPLATALPQPDPDELDRRLDAVRLALGADRLAVARRLTGGEGSGSAFEILAQSAPGGRVDPVEKDVPFTFVAGLLRDGRPQEWTRHAVDPGRRRALVTQGMTWLGGWPLPSDRWPCVVFVAWCRRRRDPGTVRRRVAEAGMEALARALVPPPWLAYAPMRPVAGDPAEAETAPPADEATGDDSLAAAMARIERDLIVKALQAAEGNKTVAARSLRLSRQGLYRKLRRHGLLAPRRRARQRADA